MTMLLKQPSFLELEPMERRFRRLMEGVGFAPSVMPAADVYETAGEFVVELEVPGYEEKELGVVVSDHMLTIKGTRSEMKEEKERSFRLHERLEAEFERTFELPPEIDSEHVAAVFEKGVLKVHAPKASLTEPRKVEITKP